MRHRVGLFLLVQLRVLDFVEQHFERAALDDLERVDDVALALGHLLAVLVADDGVQEDLLEGEGLVGEVVAHDDHAGDPEEEDVVAGLEDGVRVEGLEVCGLVGPAEDGEGVQRGGEPGVEDVFVLREDQVVSGGAVLLFCAARGFLEVAADDPVFSVVEVGDLV